VSLAGATEAPTGIDPVTFEVLRSALVQVTQEMGVALRHSAYSTNIKTRADYSCAIFDRNVRLLAQGFDQPSHLGSMSVQVPTVLNRYGVENLNPGDAIVTNHPYIGGVHLNDITIIAPVHHEGELAGFVANLAHHVDVGGGAPGSVGSFREVYQEGIIIPPVKLVVGGELDPNVFELMVAQIRSKHETAGDFRAQLAANATGIRRLTSLLEKMGSDTVHRYTDELLNYAERRARAEIELLPRAEFEATGFVDNDGFSDDPVHLSARIVIDSEGVLFDFTGSDPQRRAPVDSTYAQTLSACAYVLKCLVGEDVPANEGFYRTLRVIAPEGTVVNCREPSPVVGGWETAMRLTDIIFEALAPGLPDRVAAHTKGMVCHAAFGGSSPGTGEYYCFLETLAGGYGGRSVSDGPDAVQTHGQNTENAPIEETERSYPVRIVRYELIDDSEGAGRQRGGLGLRRDYLFPENEATFSILADRDVAGPPGLFGGLPGQPATYWHARNGEWQPLGSKTTVELQQGDVISYQTCGGGGYGPPQERSPQAVVEDVRQGKVSLSRAREVYRVAIATDGELDADETEGLRAARGEGA
jgi:N-methylhydantoinase B